LAGCGVGDVARAFGGDLDVAVGCGADSASAASSADVVSVTAAGGRSDSVSGFGDGDYGAVVGVDGLAVDFVARGGGCQLIA